MNDLISRQAAIDALADYLRRVCLVFSDYMTDDESKECATCILQSVPSAQPEIIRCKDCKYYSATLEDIDPRPICHKTMLHYKPDDYCSYAERRTDAAV